MQQFTFTAVPPPRFIYEGTSAERLALQSPGALDQFWETDTGLGYIYTGLTWSQNYEAGIPLYVPAP